MKKFIIIGIIALIPNNYANPPKQSTPEFRTITESFLKYMEKGGPKPEKILYGGNPNYQYIKIVGKNGKPQNVELAPRVIYRVVEQDIVKLGRFYVISVTYIKE